MPKIEQIKITERTVERLRAHYNLSPVEQEELSEKNSRGFLVEIREFWDRKYVKKYIMNCVVKREGQQLVITDSSKKVFRKIIGGKNLTIFNNKDVLLAHKRRVKEQKQYITSLRADVTRAQRAVEAAERELAKMLAP